MRAALTVWSTAGAVRTVLPTHGGSDSPARGRTACPPPVANATTAAKRHGVTADKNYRISVDTVRNKNERLFINRHISAILSPLAGVNKTFVALSSLPVIQYVIDVFHTRHAINRWMNVQNEWVLLVRVYCNKIK